MSQERRNTFEIEDMTEEVFNLTLAYIYTDKLPALPEMKHLKGLLTAAERYKLRGLKAHCEKYLITLLEKKNAVGYLIIAEDNNANDLKEAALKLIAQYARIMNINTYFLAILIITSFQEYCGTARNR